MASGVWRLTLGILPDLIGKVRDESLDPLTGDGRHREQGESPFCAEGVEYGEMGIMGKIDLIGGNDAGAIQ